MLGFAGSKWNENVFCSLWVSPSPKDEAEAKLSSVNANSGHCGTEEGFWARNWEAGVVHMDRLTRRVLHLHKIGCI